MWKIYNYNQNIWLKTKPPLCFLKNICNYTETVNIKNSLAKGIGQSVELVDNKLSLMAG